MDQKSAIDFQKEKLEEETLKEAIRLAKTKKKLTRGILSILDGEKINMPKNDRPDIIIRSQIKQKTETEVIIGIEHFLVEQVSEKKKGHMESVVRKNDAYIRKLIEAASNTHNQTQINEIREKLCDPIFDTAAKANQLGMQQLKKAFHEAFQSHLSNVKDYRDNLEQIAEGKPVLLAFLIEIHCNANEVFLNNGKTVEYKHSHLYPIMEWMIEELETINPEKLEYVVLYQQNSIHSEIEDVVAIETKDIRGSFRKQGEVIYDYCDDPGKIVYRKTRLLDGGLEYSVDVDNRDSYSDDIMPALQKAYDFRKRSIPFLAPRSIQGMMYAHGKAQFINQNGRLMLKSEFSKDEALRRFDSFVKKYSTQGHVTGTNRPDPVVPE